MSNNWDGKGLPPVGTKCIAITDWCDSEYIRRFHGKEVEIVAHDHCRYGEMSVFRMDTGFGYSYHALSNKNCDSFKPIKSDRDKAIDEMELLMHKRGYMINPHAYAELYDLGYRKNNQGNNRA